MLVVIFVFEILGQHSFALVPIVCVFIHNGCFTVLMPFLATGCMATSSSFRSYLQVGNITAYSLLTWLLTYLLLVCTRMKAFICFWFEYEFYSFSKYWVYTFLHMLKPIMERFSSLWTWYCSHMVLKIFKSFVGMMTIAVRVYFVWIDLFWRV